MSRFHIHISVDDLQQSIDFYQAVFGSEPTVSKPDYAKWQLDDPKINFAISARGGAAGINHIGIQADTDEQLAAIQQRVMAAGIVGLAEENANCCYANSDKYWVQDPQGIPWEAFHTLSEAPLFGATPEVEPAGPATPEESSACCVPNLSRCCA